MRNIKFEVYRFKSDSTMDIMFRQTVEIPVDIKCPFQDIIDVLKFLYPKSIGVMITIMD